MAKHTPLRTNPLTLNLGPGLTGHGDIKIDLVQYPGQHINHILDFAVEPIPYPDNTFDRVVAAQVLEHIPTQIRWYGVNPNDPIEPIRWHLRFSRVELMREIHRVLKPNGVFRASVPIRWPEWAQDPSHADVPWTKEQFSYFCAQWGGNEPGKEATESSGINFAFEMVFDEINPEGSILTVELRKPND